MHKRKSRLRTGRAGRLALAGSYLVGNTDLLLDADVIKKIQEIQKLKPEDKSRVFALLDAFLKQTKIQRLMQ